MMNHFTQLKKIAQSSLRACYVDGKVVASPTHFSDFWARDTFWAVPGMIAIGDTKRVKNCLIYFLSHQRADGKIPRKVSRDITIVKYLFGKTMPRRTPRPTYYGLVPPFHTTDSELLLVIAAAQYINATHDHDFARTFYQSLRRALQWHITRASNHLVHGYFLSDWMDTVMKFGPVLYTNVLYVKALESMAAIAHSGDEGADAEKFRERGQRARHATQETFCSAAHGFCVDEARLPQRATFDLAGNTLAVLWGVATMEQSRRILKKIDLCYARDGVFMGAVPDGQKWWKVNPVVAAMGIADYHTATNWSWITAVVGELFATHGRMEQAQEIFVTLEEIALRDNEIGETYFTNGMPYKKLLWKSATPFAWGSGVILAVLAQLEK